MLATFETGVDVRRGGVPMGVSGVGCMPRGGVDGFEFEEVEPGVEGWKKFRRKLKKAGKKLTRSGFGLKGQLKALKKSAKSLRRDLKKAGTAYGKQLKRSGKQLAKAGKKAAKVVADNPALAGALTMVPGVGPMLAGPLSALGALTGGVKAGEKYSDSFLAAQPGLAPFDMPSGGWAAEAPNSGGGIDTKTLAVGGAVLAAVLLVRSRR